MCVSRFRRLRRIGLTLIELVIVMVILATLAALVIPRLGFIQQQSIPVSGAAGAADLMGNLETFKATTGFYPQGFDSLLASGGGSLMTGLIQGPSGTPPSMPFAAGSISSDPYLQASFGAGFGPSSGTSGTVAYRIYDQDSGYASNGEDVSSSFNTYRELYSTGAVAIVPNSSSSTTGSSGSTSYGANGIAIWQAAFPGGSSSTGTVNTGGGSGSGGTTTNTTTYTPPASANGVTLVAFGVGPNCNAVGGTMASAPMQTGQSAGIYARYFAIFAVYGTGGVYPGKPAELKCVVDSYYNTINANVGLYRQATPIDQ